MLPRRVMKFLSINAIRRHSVNRRASTGRSMDKLFFEPGVQELLEKLTSIELGKIFQTTKIGERLEPPQYKFMTDYELEEALKSAESRAQKWRQIPPVLNARKDAVNVIIDDAALDGHDIDGASFVFTDITYGVPEQERLIVVRTPEGTLRTANWDERQRMNAIYNPRPGRDLIAPQMFQEEHLERLLSQKEYKFILDRACAQYEPDDPDYVKVTSTTYLRVEKEQDFDYLRDTRHFGAAIYYLTFNKQIDTLLVDSLKNNRLDNAVALIQLYHLIHPTCTSAKQSTELQGTDLVRAYNESDSVRKDIVELALKSYMEQEKAKQFQDSQQGKIHGVNQM